MRRLWPCLWVLFLAGCRTAVPGQVTAPPLPAQAKLPAPKLHFVAYGDCRSRPDKHKQVVAAIAKLAPELVVNSGDLVGDGADEKLWQQAIDIIAPLRAKGDYYLAMGNHERGVVDISKWLPTPAAPGTDYFTVLKANCLFIFLDTNTLRLPGKDAEQFEWFKGELAKHATNPHEHLFVIMHHPPFALGKGLEGGDGGIRKRLHPLLVAAKPDAVFCGHDHLYYHTDRDGVRYVVSAGGGAPLHEPEPQRAKPGDVFKKSLNFVDVRVDGDRASFVAYDESGAELDRFEAGRP